MRACLFLAACLVSSVSSFSAARFARAYKESRAATKSATRLEMATASMPGEVATAFEVRGSHLPNARARPLTPPKILYRLRLTTTRARIGGQGCGAAIPCRFYGEGDGAVDRRQARGRDVQILAAGRHAVARLVPRRRGRGGVHRLHGRHEHAQGAARRVARQRVVSPPKMYSLSFVIARRLRGRVVVTSSSNSVELSVELDSVEGQVEGPVIFGADRGPGGRAPGPALEIPSSH